MKGLVALLVNEDVEVSKLDTATCIKWIYECFGDDNIDLLEKEEDVEKYLKTLCVTCDAELVDVNNDISIYKNIKERLERSDSSELYDGIEEEVNEILGCNWIEDSEVVVYLVPMEYSSMYVYIFN